MNDKSITISFAGAGDASNLTVLKQHVWIETYATEGIRNEFSEYLLNNFTIDNEITALNNVRRKTLIASKNNHLIGCAVVVFDAECPVQGSNSSAEISVLYVLERFTGIGAGKKLLSHAIRLMQEEGYGNAWLTVYHKNTRAIGFYRHFGFTDAGKTYFSMQENQYENRIMTYLI
ncbi:GNAT family N-acetyltransferase [Lentimicrobium sp.]|uniref:GNAT family N-acetyltransferase n=1 Tax=Lentimicrobium sp. TaxID=2034841 RepID=UPI00345E649C